MHWRNKRENDNAGDRHERRGMSIPTDSVTRGVGGISIVAIVLLAMLFCAFPRTISDDMPKTRPQQKSVPALQVSPKTLSEQINFVSMILATTEEVWAETFTQMGKTYQPPKLVLFSRRARSACGVATSAMGPFYCPGDRKVYLDLSFFADLQRKIGVTGAFVRAYVIAHEVGHHVQNLLGIMQKKQQLMHRAASRAEKNRLSIMLELQADCYAGFWAKRADQKRHILEPGDIEKGLKTAAAVGDDRMQKRTQGYVLPNSFTHGSSVHRVYWFKRGYEAGEYKACDTFAIYQNKTGKGAGSPNQ